MRDKPLVNTKKEAHVDQHEQRKKEAESQADRPSPPAADGGDPVADRGHAGGVGEGEVQRPGDGGAGGGDGVHAGERPDDPAAGYVYLIEAPGGLYKIGRSVNPLARLSQIAPRAAGLKLVSYIATADSVWLERYMHEAFSHRRVRGEWFNLSEAESELFASIVTADNTDQLPQTLVARRVQNEANNFEWGEQDEFAPIPVRQYGHGVQFYTDRHTFEAIEAYIASLPLHKRPKKRDVIESALHILLAQEGFWPPKKGEAA